MSSAGRKPAPAFGLLSCHCCLKGMEVGSRVKRKMSSHCDRTRSPVKVKEGEEEEEVRGHYTVILL